MSSPPTPRSPATYTKVLIGSLSGSAIEWFDFFLYATAAALIFNKQFFPTGSVHLVDAVLSIVLPHLLRPPVRRRGVLPHR